MSENILKRIEKLELRLDLLEKAIELRLQFAESDIGKLSKYGFNFSDPIITPLPEDYPINNIQEEHEDCLFTGLLGKTKCTPELRKRYPNVCGGCGHNPDQTAQDSDTNGKDST